MAVVDFPNKPEQIWVCLCGCSTFELLASGATRCASCSVVSQNNGGWYTPPVTTEYTGAEPFVDVQANGEVEFSRRRLSRRAMDPETCCIVVLSRNGEISTWSDIETQEQSDWVKRRLSHGAELINTVLKRTL
jgi:hypothetical protein